MKTKYEMMNIKNSIEEIVEAINSVIRVDVTVIDSKYNRIATTGLYIDNFGETVAKNSVFYKALKTGQEFIVETPREDEVCFDCDNKVNCLEYAEVCCPIFVEDNIVGIIGLIAFDEYQKNQIIGNKLNLLNFLRKMADLISTKILENKTKEVLLSQAKQIEVLFDYIDNALIVIYATGKVVRCNNEAKDMFNVNIGDNISELDEILGELNYEKYENYSGKINKIVNGKVTRIMYNTKPIIIENKVKKIIITFSREKDLIDVMNDIVNIRQQITFDDIIGKGPSCIKLKQEAAKAANSTSTVLIQGESGTGKELYARAIHFGSDRKFMPFVAVNCAAFPENLIESELFGYNEGAFSGALKGGKPGKFEIADKGTIFLDEIGEMPIHLQSKLLRVLQEREVERVGGVYSTPIDIRVIAATNQDLEELIKEKKFRADLYYRLNVIPLKLVPLREKIEDVVLLSDVFLKRYNIKLHKNIGGFDEKVIKLFKSYKWKGNIREMENVIEYAVNMCKTDNISLEDVPSDLLVSGDVVVSGSDEVQTVYSLAELEKNEIKKALNLYKRDKEGINIITKLLGISRATLYRKIKEYNI